MGLEGSGAVAIWHDIAVEAKDEFYAWHGEEHMPERIAIPGFLRGRRYCAIRADLEFFNLYETTSLEVLTGPDYQSRLNNPTAWTMSTVKHFKHVARSICHVAATFGQGQGGLVSTWRYDVPEAKAESHINALSETVLPELLNQKIIAGAHLLTCDTAASAVDTVERKVRDEENRIPRWIVIVEGWGDERPFAELCATKLSDVVLSSTGASGAANVGLYRLQVTATPPNNIARPESV
jgi:hypothetical protein